ncbi:hypothetical protein ABKN59_009962 [Abortiporus biennis]
MSASLPALEILSLRENVFLPRYHFAFPVFPRLHTLLLAQCRGWPAHENLVFLNSQTFPSLKCLELYENHMSLSIEDNLWNQLYRVHLGPGASMHQITHQGYWSKALSGRGVRHKLQESHVETLVINILTVKDNGCISPHTVGHIIHLERALIQYASEQAHKSETWDIRGNLPKVSLWFSSGYFIFYDYTCPELERIPSTCIKYGLEVEVIYMIEGNMVRGLKIDCPMDS